jgi:hypothetical protein
MVMDLMLSLAGTVLWAVFLVAGVRKLRDTAATAASMRGLGVPAAAANGLAPLLPFAELAVVVLLLVPGLALPGLVLGFGLLLLFTVAIVAALLRGRRPACNCFGQASDQPISWLTAARNGVLLAFAGGLLLQSTRLDAGLAGLWVATARNLDLSVGLALMLGGLLALQTLVVGKLFTQQGRMLLRIDNLEHELAQRGRDTVTHSVPSSAGPRIGAEAPDFELMPLAGGAVQAMAQRLAARRDLVLVFVNHDCAPCHELLDWLVRQPERGQAIVITSGSPQHNRRLRKGYEGLDIVIQSGQQAQDLYGVIGTPSAVRVRDGRIASAMAIGMAPIQSLFTPPASGALPAAPATGAPGLA